MEGRPTEKLWWTAPELLSFEATVVGIEKAAPDEEGRERVAVTLDRTCFCPAGGGQPADGGVLAGRVVELLVAGEKGVILHVLRSEEEEGAEALAVGQTVQGQVDERRRRDISEHHTAQHIFSGALVRLSGLRTLCWRLGSSEGTIDLNAWPIDEGALRAAEDVTNDAIMRETRVCSRVHAELSSEGQRVRGEEGAQEMEGPVRVVSIGQEEACVCGGTHLTHAGLARIFKILRVEKMKKHARLVFLSGGRCIDDYRAKTTCMSSLCTALSVGDVSSAAPAVDRLVDDLRTCRATLRQVRKRSAELEAKLLSGEPAVELQGRRMFAKVLEGRDGEELRTMAECVVALSGANVLVALASVVVARSSEKDGPDCRAVLRRVLGEGGKGGGKPQIAQGQGNRVDGLQQALAAACDVP